MKFRQKLLIAIAALFIVFSDVCSIVLVNKYNELIIDRELMIARNESKFIAGGIKSSLDDIRARGGIAGEQAIQSVIDTYAGFYEKEDVRMAIIPKRTAELPIFLVEHDIVIERDIPDYDVILAYKRNIDSVYALQDEWNRFFLVVNTSVSFLLIIALYFIVKRLTFPLEQLSIKTDQIKAGNYTGKITVAGNDEFSELGVKFNAMTDEIQTKVEELKSIADEKQFLVDNIAHEMKTPLTSIQGFSETLLRMNVTEEDRITALAHLNSEAARLKELVEKLLEIAVISRRTIRFDEVNTDSVIESVSKALYAKCKSKNIALTFLKECESLYGDQTLLSALLINLAGNAVNASFEGGLVEISIKAEQDETVIQIKDDGCGLTDVQLQKVFEPFYRVNKDRSRENGGSGLGLALCKKIVEAHGGNISMASEPEKGTCVFINLPLVYKLDKTL